MSDIDESTLQVWNEGTLQVWNVTDGLPATEEWFKTPEEAKQFIKEFRQRYKDLQGYYLTSDRKRIDPDEIRLKIKGTYLGRRYRDDD